MASTTRYTVPQCEAFIRLLLELGFRRGEALNLSWSDVDERAKTVSLEGWKHKPGRTFRISTDILALLQRLQQQLFDVVSLVQRGGRLAVPP